MKRISIFLGVLLAMAAFSHADTINLTSGSGNIYPGFPGFTFRFYGGGYGLYIPQALDQFNGLVNCHPCDPTQEDSLFGAAGQFTNGQQYLIGQFHFDAVSFVSSLAPSGILTVTYTATASLYLFLVDSSFHEIGPFVWGDPNQPWYVTAQFKPDIGLPVYELLGATLSTSIAPEPATIMLFGTGILPLLFGVRGRLSRSGNGTRR
jgi:hypothetical protein